MNDIAAIKASEEYKRLKSLLGDREWRLDNLYFIRDEDGNTVKFVRNDAQRAFSGEMWSRDLIPKARKLGFSTFIAIYVCDGCVFRSGTVAGIVDRSLDDACDKLGMVKFAYDRLPQNIRDAQPLVRQNAHELAWANGSTVTVGTTYRGGTPTILHISEYGKISVDSPETAREIKTGAIQSVPASGKIFVESTAHGNSGAFCDMVKSAEAKKEQKSELTNLDFKLHFYGWWKKREYRLPNNLVIIPQELKGYFAELQAKHGIRLDADQMAWYAKKHEELGPDDIKQEFPSCLSELFYASLEGAYWKKELTKARQEGRIGQLVPHDPTRRVNTFWDIGEDCTAVLFHQTDGVRHRFIDYYEEEGGSLQAAAGILRDKERERGFSYDKHYGPHDLENRDWAAKAKTRVDTAKDLGLTFTVVPRIGDKADSIDAARRMIGMSWFDAEHCARLVECLDNYRKKWNDRLGVFLSDPVHDWACHAADAIQQGAMGLVPDKPSKEGRHRMHDAPRSSQWAA